MKRFVSSLLALCLLSCLTACGNASSESGKTQETNPFLGTWSTQEDGSTLTVTFLDNGTFSVSVDGEKSEEGTYTWKSDGTGEATAEDTSVSLSISGDQVKLTGDAGENYTFTKGDGGGAQPQETNTVQPETANAALKGTWYNYDECTLEFDGAHLFTCSNPDQLYSGTYQFDGTALNLFANGNLMTGRVKDGDLTVGDLNGTFSQVSEDIGTTDAVNSEILDDATSQYWNYTKGVSFQYSTWMTVITDWLGSGALVSDNSDGFVVGRNITDWYNSSSETDEAFLGSYFQDYVYSDFEALYGADWDTAGYDIYEEEASGRIATGDINLYNSYHDIYVKVLIYYTDDNDVIAKSFFAPYDNSDEFNALYSQVVSMTDC